MTLRSQGLPCLYSPLKHNEMNLLLSTLKKKLNGLHYHLTDTNNAESKGAVKDPVPSKYSS